MSKDFITLKLIPFTVGFIGFQLIFHLVILPISKKLPLLPEQNTKQHQVK